MTAMKITMEKDGNATAIRQGDKCSGMLYSLGDMVVFGPMRAIEWLMQCGMEAVQASRYIAALKNMEMKKEFMES